MPVFNISTAPEKIPSASLELFHTSGTPYVDFHGTDLTRDYDARIIYYANNGKVSFSFNADVTGGVTIEKGGLTITGNETVNGHTYITGAHHIYFDSGHGHGIIWRENTTTYAGEALYVGGYFLGDGDSNYLHIQGSTTGGTSASWHDIMRLTATNGNLWIKGTGTFGNTLTVNNTAYITGQLQLDNSSMDRTVSPSETQYHGIFYRDKNDRRLVNLEYMRSTNGTAQLNLFVLQPNTTKDSYAGMVIYRQTDGKVYAQVGNSSISGGILRNIQCRNSSSGNVATQYLITNRL